MRLEELDKLEKKNHLIGSLTLDLPACNISRLTTTLPHAPRWCLGSVEISNFLLPQCSVICNCLQFPILHFFTNQVLSDKSQDIVSPQICKLFNTWICGVSVAYSFCCKRFTSSLLELSVDGRGMYSPNIEWAAVRERSNRCFLAVRGWQRRSYPESFVGAAASGTGALWLRFQEVVLSVSFQRSLIHPRDNDVSTNHLTASMISGQTKRHVLSILWNRTLLIGRSSCAEHQNAEVCLWGWSNDRNKKRMRNNRTIGKFVVATAVPYPWSLSAVRNS
jgi:hypothetical protein